MKLKFYHCPVCGNVVVSVVDSNVVPVCCGSPMEILVPKTAADELQEKHVPVIKKRDHCSTEIKVGSQPHPMNDEHFIEFLCVQMERRFEIKKLRPEEEPRGIFFCEEKIVAAYAYCNKHGLWMSDPAECCSTTKEKNCKL